MRKINFNSIFHTKFFRTVSFFSASLILINLFADPVYAHRGKADEVDDCIIRVGTENVHFTAYTPTFTAGKDYCNKIPNIGQTNLVFDYEGEGLRNTSVEFEVTKEPEGSRVFYQEPKKIRSGTINGMVDFSKYGAGDYLAHVTIMHEGEKLDTHLPFSIGVADDSEGLSGLDIGKLLLTITILGAAAYFLFQMYRVKGDTENMG